MDPLFDDEAFVARWRGKHTEAKRALLDQTLISGVGNIYADEALWRAKLHGARPTDQMTRPSVRRLLATSATCCGEAIVAGGTQLRRAVRERERRERLLRPVAQRVRPGG